MAVRCAQIDDDGADWRAVVGFKGRYEVAPDGRVRTVLSRVPRHYKTELRTRPNEHGYPVVTLRAEDGRTHCQTVHGIVARAFLGPCPEGMQIAHSDGTRTNSHVSNLRYATPAENQADRLVHGTDRNGDKNPTRLRPERVARGERCGTAKLTADLVRAIRAANATGLGQKRLAKLYGVRPSTIWEILAGRTWRHVV
jgi:hypothetical protein